MAAPDVEETKTLTAQCFCKAVHFTVTIPKSKLPLGVHLCHCSICRYTHGVLCNFHAPLPDGITPKFIAPSSMDNLTEYHPTKNNDKYMFCSTCGCQVGGCAGDNSDWILSASIFDRNNDEPGVWNIQTHICSKSAKDGGLVDWLPRIGDREMKHWNPDKDRGIVEAQPEVGPDGEDRLRAQCHCGGVSFTIRRPTKEVLEHEQFKTLVSPVDKTKWIATLDFCDDCRLMSGVHVIQWTFLPRSLVDPPIGEDLLIGTSKTYQSSPDVLRSFCGTCGAKVFYSCDDRKLSPHHQMLDIAVGILRAPEGPRAENWLTWRTGRSSWFASGERYDREFTHSLAEAMAKWDKEKSGETRSFEIGF